MSIRAYRINKIDHEQAPSFNLWHNTDFMEFIGDLPGLNDDNSGVTEVSLEQLEEYIALHPDDDINKELKADIEWAIANKTDYVQYYCF